MSRLDRQLHLPEQLDVPRDSTRLGEGEGEARVAISYVRHYKEA